jgi:hypothetical protein
MTTRKPNTGEPYISFEQQANLFRTTIGTRAHYKGEKLPPLKRGYFGTIEEAISARDEWLVELGKILRQPQFLEPAISGFEGVGAGVIAPENEQSKKERRERSKTASFWTYVMRCTPIGGGPVRAVAGYTRNPRERANAYAQLGYNVRLVHSEVHEGKDVARSAESVLISSLARSLSWQQVAREAFVFVRGAR